MTNEERDLIVRFIARVGGAPGAGFGSVPGTGAAPALPPVDPEAKALIAQELDRVPDAQYRLTQTAFVQEAALAEAQNRIQRLQYELDQARRAQPASRGGFLSGLFGGGGRAAGPAPYQQPYQSQPYQPPQYAPGMAQPGMFRQGGSGFLGSALTTAAGVAGGMVAGNALMGLFSHHEGGGMFGGGGFGQEAAPMGADPWGGAGMTPEPSPDWSKEDAYQQQPDPGWGDAGQAPSGDPGWGDAGGGSDGGWSDGGGDGGNW